MNGEPRRGRGIIRATILLGLLLAVKAQAHTFIVTDTNDSTAVTSLRGAIIAANQNGGENTIILGEEPRRHQPPQAWTFYLTIRGINEYAAQTGDLDVTGGNLTIVGATSGVTIDASSLGDRVFHVYSGARLDLENVIIRGGSKPYPQAPGGGGGIIITLGGVGAGGGLDANRQQGFGTGPDIGPIMPPTPLAAANFGVAGGIPSTSSEPTNGGGGILNNGEMTMRKCVVTGNSTVGDDGGGGILNSGSLVMENCAVTNNWTTGDDGGAIWNVGSLKADNCNISWNADYQGNGGAIYNIGKMILTGCQIDNNSAPPALGGDGGGIYGGSAGTLEMAECTISSNSCAGGGGGLFNAGLMKQSHCKISHNVANGGSGGGISNPGELVMENCSITENSLNTAGGPNGNGGDGGGVHNRGMITMRSCTLSDNFAGSGGTAGFTSNVTGNGGNGGGIYSTNSLYLVCCTVSGNSAGRGGVGGGLFFTTDSNDTGGSGGNGGGIYSSGELLLSSSTIVSNFAGAGGTGGVNNFFPSTNGTGGTGGNGGGIYEASDISSAQIQNTIVALNVPGQGGPGGVSPGPITIGGLTFGGLPPNQIGAPGLKGMDSDVFGLFNSGGFNLIGAGDGSSGFVNGVGADQVGSMVAPIDPMIGPLQMNGGPTATHALLPGSPAVDQGDSFGIHEDQRGYPRPYNFRNIPNAAGGDGSDIGAFELERDDGRRSEEGDGRDAR
jgi:hypothetical protein